LLTVLFGLSIYGGNNVQPPPPSSLTTFLRIRKAQVNSSLVGHGGISQHLFHLDLSWKLAGEAWQADVEADMMAGEIDTKR
jgi:hypothetical protein